MRELIIEKFEEPDEIDCFGIVYWKNRHGKWSRDNDKPAIIYPDGERWWMKDGGYFRKNGKPTITRANGPSDWHINNCCIKKTYYVNKKLIEITF